MNALTIRIAARFCHWRKTSLPPSPGGESTPWRHALSLSDVMPNGDDAPEPLCTVVACLTPASDVVWHIAMHAPGLGMSRGALRQLLLTTGLAPKPQPDLETAMRAAERIFAELPKAIPHVLESLPDYDAVIEREMEHTLQAAMDDRDAQAQWEAAIAGVPTPAADVTPPEDPLLPQSLGWPVYVREGDQPNRDEVSIDGFAALALPLQHLSDDMKRTLALLPLRDDWRPPTGQLELIYARPGYVPAPPGRAALALQDLQPLVLTLPGDDPAVAQDVRHLAYPAPDPLRIAYTADGVYAYLETGALKRYLEVTGHALVRLWRIGGLQALQRDYVQGQPSFRFHGDHLQASFAHGDCGADIQFPDDLAEMP